jgi:hypothetical protein
MRRFSWEDVSSFMLEALSGGGIPAALIKDQLSRLRRLSADAPPDARACCGAVSEVSLEDSNLPLLNEPIRMPDLGLSPEVVRPKKRHIDIHGFNQGGAEVVIRRTLLNLDRSNAYEIKVCVGKGIHSEKEPILAAIVHQVCDELGFDRPERLAQNAGYLLITVPALTNREEDES